MLDMLVWDRSSPRPTESPADLSAPLQILAAVGLFANRREVARLVGRPREQSTPALLAALHERTRLEAPRQVAGTLSWIVWDDRRRHLLAVGDRLGLSPLYCCQRGRTLYLATSLEPLLAALGCTDIEPQTVAAYLGGRPSHASTTFYRGIEVVPAGGYLLATPERVVTARYWRLDARSRLRLAGDSSYAEALREGLAEVVSEHLQEAPTAAITLSGGLDSTSLAATLREISPRLRLTAVCGVSPELPEADESALSRAVCERLGGAAVTVEMDQHWPLRSDPGIRPRRESPRFNCYTDFWVALCARVREAGETVLLTGQGGDYLFGGNVFAYADLLLTGRWGRLAGELRRHRELWGRSSSWIWRWMILGPLVRTYLPLPRRSSTPRWLGAALRPLVAPESWSRPDWRLLPGRLQRLDLLRHRVLFEEARHLNDLAAEHGVELRNPYFDHRLFELAVALPAEQTFDAGVRKGILRRAMAGRLPEEVLARPGKVGSTPIFERGLKERETAKVWQLLTDMRAADLGWVDQERVRAAYRDYVEGRTRSTRFWQALTLEAWLRRWF
jgi:asparagine synthase (glutamine-hydrolysing)